MPAPIAAAAAVAATPAATPAPVQTSAPKAVAEPSKAGPEGAAKTPPAETPKPPEPAKRFKAKYKENGKDVELDLDEAEALREIQKARHYDRTRPQAEARERQLQQTLEAIKKNPKGWLNEQGIDVRALAAEDMAREAELAKLSPEARRAAELEQQLNETREQLKQREVNEAKQREIAEDQQLVQGTIRTLDAAIKVSGRQRSGELLKDYATVMEMAERAGEPPMSPEQIVAAGERLELKRIKSTIERAMKDPAWRQRNGATVKELAQAVLPALEGQELVDFVGKENVERISRAALAVYRKNPLPVVVEAGGPPPPKPAEPRQTERKSASIWNTLDNLVR